MHYLGLIPTSLFEFPVVADAAVPPGTSFQPFHQGPIYMHPDTWELLRIELSPGTYGEKCLAREMVRYRRRKANYVVRRSA
jgi:hypothetical protein